MFKHGKIVQFTWLRGRKPVWIGYQMDHHLLKPVITWQWLHALGWNLALTFCKLYKCEFFFVANEQKKLSLNKCSIYY